MRKISKNFIESHGQTLHIIITGEGQSDATAYMIVDKGVIDTVEMAELPFALIAAFFVYNFFVVFFHMFTGSNNVFNTSIW